MSSISREPMCTAPRSRRDAKIKHDASRPEPAPMTDRSRRRRGIMGATLLLPLLLAGCGDGQRTDFPALHYGYLQPIRLNVATIAIEQHFRPSGIAPDVTQLDPAPPADALRA